MAALSLQFISYHLALTGGTLNASAKSVNKYFQDVANLPGFAAYLLETDEIKPR